MPNPFKENFLVRLKRLKSQTRMSRFLFGCFFLYITLFSAYSIILLGQTTPQRVEVTRDTWFSNAGDEALGSNGASPRLKLKSIQELSLIDIDPAPFRGRTIQRAQLFLKTATDQTIDRVTISSIASPWVEGTATGYAQEVGTSTFSFQSYPDKRWWDGDITSVILGQGGTQWASIAPQYLADGWIQLELPIELVELRVAGLSDGFLLFDDTGSEWKRDGDSFQHQLFPNRYVFSKDSNRASAPYLELTLGKVDSDPPSSPVDLNWQTRPSADSSLEHDYFLGCLEWKSQKDSSGKPPLGFQLRVDGKLVPNYYLPRMEEGNSVCRMWLDPKSPAWDPNESHLVQLVAVDGAGNQSSPASIELPSLSTQLSIQRTEQSVSGLLREPAKDASETDPLEWESMKDWENRSLAIVDPYDKFVSAHQLLPSQRKTYLQRNVLWSANERKIELQAGKGMWVGFQLALKDSISDLKMEWEIPKELSEAQIEVARYADVSIGNGRVHDPMIPIEPPSKTNSGKPIQFDLMPKLNQNFPITPDDSSSVDPASKLPKCWLTELYIPQGVAAGRYECQIRLISRGKTCVIKCGILIHDVAIPNRLSFLPEMNCYDLPANEEDYYRMAHRHRVTLNRVPYYQNGKLATGCAPEYADGKLDFGAWDRRYSKYFDGTAFKDLPRGTEPMECFYLPMHENWPMSMEGNYRGGYWAEDAFPKSYRKSWMDVAEQFAQHFQESGWTETRFHILLNNKVDFKKRGWSRGSSVWLLDEPANYQDFEALRYFGQASRDGIARRISPTKSNVMYRADISRPQWQRETLDGLLRYNVVSQTAFRTYPRMILERRARESQTLMIYGAANHPSTSNSHAMVWCWDTWCRGADGVLPWQTIGNSESWKIGDDLALFYPVNDREPPVPSIRLKAYCEGQQDVELFRILAEKLGCSRYQLGEILLKQWSLRSEAKRSSGVEEDAGWADYGRWSPEELRELRWKILSALESSL